MEHHHTGQLVEVGNVALSAHAQLRMKQRGIPPEAVKMAVQYGRINFRKGAVHYAVGTKEIEKYRASKPRIEKYNGIRVVCAHDSGMVVTAYRNPNFSNI